MLVEQSTEGGTLLREDARLLEGVFEFSEKTAQEVMTPRTQMVALEADLPWRGRPTRSPMARRSRYPVYTESLDEIVGVVHAKDILTALRSRPGVTGPRRSCGRRCSCPGPARSRTCWPT